MVLRDEPVAVLGDKQSTGRQFAGLVHRVVHVVIVAGMAGTATDVDRTGGSTDSGSDAEDGDQRQTVGTELGSGSHAEMV